MWSLLLYQPILNALIAFYLLLGHNLGFAIIGLTLAIRGLLTPLVLPSLKASSKLRQLQPELEKLSKKYAQDKQKLAQAQLALYKKHGVNPAAGCLPQIVQLVVLIALFQAFNQVLRTDGNTFAKLQALLYPFLRHHLTSPLNLRFLYLDLSRPDAITFSSPLTFAGFQLNQLPGPLLLLTAAVQFLSSRLMMPVQQTLSQQAKKTPSPQDDLAVTMQKQMLIIFPLMTLLVGLKFPSGLVLYWLTFSLFMLAQQLLIKRQNSHVTSPKTT